jgi:hypothetical protein
MRKLFTAVLLFTAGFAHAQSVTPEVVANAGDYFTSATAQLSWTLGEPVIDTWSNVSATLTQGFQQNSYYLSGIEELEDNVFVTAYPNPSTGLINIGISGSTHSYTQAVLVNASGQTVGQVNLTGINRCSFDLTPFANGAYVLSIFDQQQQKQSLTIIKQ